MPYHVIPPAARPPVCDTCTWAHVAGAYWNCLHDQPDKDPEDCPEIEPWGTCEAHSPGDPTVLY